MPFLFVLFFEAAASVITDRLFGLFDYNCTVVRAYQSRLLVLLTNLSLLLRQIYRRMYHVLPPQPHTYIYMHSETVLCVCVCVRVCMRVCVRARMFSSKIKNTI